jgi:hypothetical protein
VRQIKTTPKTVIADAMTPETIATMTNTLSSAAWWNWFWQLAGVVLILLTFGAGLGAVITGSWLNTKQSTEIREQADTISKLQRATALQEGKNIEAQRALEAERTKRLEMEKSLAPRSIEQCHAAEALKQFAGLNIMIASIGDEEARNTAGQISFLAQMAGWKPVPDNPPPSDMIFPPRDGITITWSQTRDEDESDRTHDAADELKDQLGKSDVESSISSADELPANTIRVFVGLRPLTYFRNRDKSPEERARDEETERQSEELRARDRERRKDDKQERERAREIYKRWQEKGIVAPDKE